MQNLTLTTQGQWDNTLLMLNGNQIGAKVLKISLTTMGKEFGEAGLDHGGNLGAAFWTEDEAGNLVEHAMFPGTFNLQVYNGSLKTWDLQVVNLTHDLNFLATQVLIDGIDATSAITRLEVTFDYPADKVEVWYEIQTSGNELVSGYEEINVF